MLAGLYISLVHRVTNSYRRELGAGKHVPHHRDPSLATQICARTPAVFARKGQFEPNRKGCGRTMPYLLIRQNVADYEQWKSAFDSLSVTRQANGSRGGQLFRNASDPNELVILLEWDVLEKARLFAQSEELREVMQRAGVVDHSAVSFLKDGEQVSW